MNNKTVMAAAILLFLFSAIEVQPVSVVRANPFSNYGVELRLTSPENRTYTETSIPLIFTYGPADWVNSSFESFSFFFYYSLDTPLLTQFSPSIETGICHTTITVEKAGIHRLQVLVSTYPIENSTGGLIEYYQGWSSVTFSIDARAPTVSPSPTLEPTQEPTLEPTLPRPTPSLPYPPSASPSPSPSLTQEPTTEPTLTPTLTSDHNQEKDVITIILAAVVVVAVAVAPLVYFRRRKG